MITKRYLDILTYEIMGGCIEVHKHLGPGLLESVYHRCLIEEFRLRDLKFTSELVIDVNYKGIVTDTKLRCDFLIENAIVLEIKSVREFAPVHEAQILSYMKLLRKPKGILLNFNVKNLFKEGQETYVNELFRGLKDE